VFFPLPYQSTKKQNRLKYEFLNQQGGAFAPPFI
jgi:hypothetical protein